MDEKTTFQQSELAILDKIDHAKRYQTLLSSAFDFTYEANDKGCFTYLSPNFETHLGYVPADLLGTQAIDFIHPSDRANLLNIVFTGAIANQSVQFSARYWHPKLNDWRWCEATGNFINTPHNERRLLILGHDVTERKRQQQELALLVALTKAINAQLDLNSIAREVLTLLKPLMPINQILISLLSHTENDTEIKQAAGFQESGPQRQSFSISRQSQAHHPIWDLVTQKTIWVNNHYQDRSTERGNPTRSFINVPLITDGGVFGIFHLDSYEADAFDEEHKRLAGVVGEHVALAVRKTQLLLQSREQEQELALMESLAKAVNAQSNLDAMASEIKTRLQTLLPVDLVMISLIAGDSINLLATTNNWLPNSSHYFRRESHPDTEFWEAMDSQRLLVVNDWDYQKFGADSKTRAFINAPLVIEGETIGVLHLDAWQPNVFTAKHAHIVSLVAEHVAVAVQQHRFLMKAQEAEAKFRSLIHDVDAIVWEMNPQTGAFTFISPNIEQWLGFSVAQCYSGPEFWMSHIHADDRAAVMENYEAVLQSGRHHKMEYRMHSTDGRLLWLRSLITVERPDGLNTGLPIALHGITVDVTEQRSIETQLAHSVSLLQATLDSTTDGVLVVDKTGHISSHNRKFQELWDIPSAIIKSGDDKAALGFVMSQLRDPDTFLEKVSELYEKPERESFDVLEFKDGRIIERFSQPQWLHDKIVGRVWCFRDTTAHRRYEMQLAHQAFHDDLTGLPNRALFLNRLTQAVAELGRNRRPLALMFLDLDHFKVINDSLGHDIGDQLLVQVAARLKKCLRPGDTAARFGGDEFTLLLENLSDEYDAVRAAERLADYLKAPFTLGGHEVEISSSIGIVQSHSNQDRAEDLLRQADVAMYRAKGAGRARYEIFDSKMSAWALQRLELEIELRQAIKRGQLNLHYQPIVSLQSGRIVAMEALARWQHPQRGMVPPSEFIPLAEEIGMILPISQWVMRECFDQIRLWQQRFRAHYPQGLAIGFNLSATQFQQDDLAADIKRLLQEADLEASAVWLEITESLVMQNAASTISQLQELKRLGLKLSVDDFGTGYSSLSYLQRFPLDCIKIDRSFISQREGEKDDMVIARAIASLGQTLGKSVVAEGIETVEQLANIRTMGCHLGQGYYFSRPLPAQEMQSLLETNPQW